MCIRWVILKHVIANSITSRMFYAIPFLSHGVLLVVRYTHYKLSGAINNTRD